MKRKILRNFIYVIVMAVTASTVLLIWLSYGMFKNRVIDDLRMYARVISACMQQSGMEPIMDALDDDVRVTLVNADGTVAFDSVADEQTMENHAERPEIANALAQGEGSDVRDSHTLRTSTFYYALRVSDDVVLRLSREASSIWALYLHAAPMVLGLLALLIGLCVAMANTLIVHLLEPIEQMTSHLDDLSGVTRYPELEPFMDMIKTQHEEILRSANMRVEFTANVSHELKTPLTSISGYAELIESGMAQGEQAKMFAGEIHKSANRLLTLINDIIRLSQMDAPMPDMVFEPVDLAQIATSTLDQLKLSAQNLGISLQLDARYALVSADRRMMEELLYNLCDNAIRYNVRGGRVRVEVHPVRDRVIVRVQDTGIGISKENQAHVFERFYRVDKSRSKATGGTGLGLAIVKHIAAKHNAKISLQSELGTGTTIEVTFDRLARG